MSSGAVRTSSIKPSDTERVRVRVHEPARCAVGGRRQRRRRRRRGRGRGAAWPVRSVRSVRYWRALAGRSRASQSTCGNLGASRTSESSRKAAGHGLPTPKRHFLPTTAAVAVAAVVTPDATCDSTSAVSSESPRLCLRVVFGPGGHGFVNQPRGWFCELSIPSEDGNLTAHDAATPTLSLQLDWHRWHCPARPSRVQAHSERLTSAPLFAVKHGGAWRAINNSRRRRRCRRLRDYIASLSLRWSADVWWKSLDGRHRAPVTADHQ